MHRQASAKGDLMLTCFVIISCYWGSPETSGYRGTAAISPSISVMLLFCRLRVTRFTREATASILTR